MMTRQHFEFIAETIRDLEDDGIRKHVAEHFARQLGRTNSGFKPDRFLKACEPR